MLIKENSSYKLRTEKNLEQLHQFYFLDRRNICVDYTSLSTVILLKFTSVAKYWNWFPQKMDCLPSVYTSKETT